MSDFSTAFDAQIDIKESESSEVVQDTVNDESGSMFERVEQATDEGKSAKELLEEAKQELSSEDTDSSIQARTAEGASDKQPQEAAAEVNQEVEKDMINLVKAMRGEKEYEIPEDAVFIHTVDGEEVEVSLQDLKNHYSGQVVWDKRFQELDTERREYMEDKQAVEQYIDQIVSHFDKGDEIGAMEFLAEITGQDPLQVRRNLREQFMREATERSGLTEAEIKLLDTREELDFVNRRRESEEQRLMQSQAQEEAAQIINGIQETFELSDDELVSLYDSVVEKHGADVSQEQLVNLMQEQATFNQASAGAEYLLGKVEIQDTDEGMIEAVTEIILENPDFSEEDFVEVLQEAFELNSKTTSKKAKKAVSKKQDVSEKKVEQREYVSFDDL